jgi:outer membrane protein TolC
MAQANFAMTLGLPYDTEFELDPVEGEPGDIPLDVADLISQASRNKPDILELKANILTLQSSRKAQALQMWTPYLNLSWGLSPTFINNFGDKDTWADKWQDDWMDTGTFSITLGMSINSLFPFTKEGQGLKDLDNTLKTTSIGLTQMIRGTELEIYNTVLSLERIRATREAQTRTVDLAQQSYQSTEQAYQAGLQDLIQVQNAELELRRARVGVLEQYFNYLNGLIDLEYAIGVPFGTLTRSVE